ncbi:MAG: hypothetical protein HFG71_16155 [Hungatella sp.]|nr:hypothetical protein [Hungatella sp.]
MIGRLGMIWSDNLELRDNTGWFGGGEINALFQADFVSEKYKLLTPFEDDKILGVRRYTICKWLHNKVFCFPIYGDYIKVYHLDQCIWSQIDIENPEDVQRMRFSDALIYDGKIYGFTRGLRAIVEIDPEREELCNYIYIPEDLGMLSSNCLQHHNLIYCIFGSSRSLCEINVETEEINLYDVPFDVKGINTINLVGEEEFWFSGFEKIIYIWNKRTDRKTTLYLPKEFGNYRVDDNKKLILDYGSMENEDVIFIKSIDLGDNIWFIPFRSNNIVYVNKKTYEMAMLEIDGEKEDCDSWNRKMNHKYLVEYIRDERYIGLYSLKKSGLLEIDTHTYSVREKRFELDTESVERLKELILRKNIVINDREEIHKRIFIEICGDRNKYNIKNQDIGGKIYRNLCGI